MKVLAISGSPRKDGNTDILLNKALSIMSDKGFDTKFIRVAGKKVHGCVACQKCFELEKNHCIFDDDAINDCIDAMIEADVILIGSPTYFGTITAEIKALMDRSGMVTRAKGGLLKRKIGAAVVVNRRAGAMTSFNAIVDFFLINNMIVPGSTYWNIGVGREKGEINEDEEALTTIKNLCENIEYILK